MNEEFTQEELDEAARWLHERQTEIYANTYVGHRLRENALKQFKDKHKIKSSDMMTLAIEADLLNENDIGNFIRIEMNEGNN